jgi:hypothetical protein
LPSPFPTRSHLRLVFISAVLLGIVAAIVYWQRDLTLSHYDAKAHLVVARRIIDSLRPGWWQIGAVWLPLPHLLNMLPVQVDWLYRTGFSGVAISVASFALTSTTLFWLIGRTTRSPLAAVAGTLVFATQPDVLYLQSTPMTEPLLMALSLLGVALTWQWVDEGTAERPGWAGMPHGASLALAGACWTRYEAWPVTAATVGLAALALLLNRRPLREVVSAAARLAFYPVLAVVGFLILSKVTVGAWLVTDGFFVADNPAYHRPLQALVQVFWGLRQIDGNLTVIVATIAAAICLAIALLQPARRSLLVPFALAATAALPMYAFSNGHPFRIRYMVVLTVAAAALGGIGLGLLPRRLRLVAGIVFSALVLLETPPFPHSSPMIAEAQWDKPRSRERQHVTACLQEMYDGQPILASMGSLAHFMQETSRAGFNLRDYVHEGIGQIWSASLTDGARHYVGWVLIEEQAEGGDELFKLREASPRFLAGFKRICDGGGVALYKRTIVAAP